MARRANRWPKAEGEGATVRELGEEYAPAGDPLYSRVPDGTYVVGFRSALRQERFRRQTWRTDWEIAEGSQRGTPLVLFISALPEGAAPGRGYKMTSVYQVATGRRPPRDLWRRNPRSFLGDAYFEARVAAGKRDWQGADVPPEARYSKIQALLRRVAGSPPDCRREGSER